MFRHCKNTCDRKTLDSDPAHNVANSTTRSNWSNYFGWDVTDKNER